MAWVEIVRLRVSCGLKILAKVSKSKSLNGLHCHCLDNFVKRGALHGLGHLAHDYPKEVRSIIEKFLHENKIDENLKQYAMEALKGMVQ